MSLVLVCSQLQVSSVVKIPSYLTFYVKWISVVIRKRLNLSPFDLQFLLIWHVFPPSPSHLWLVLLCLLTFRIPFVVLWPVWFQVYSCFHNILLSPVETPFLRGDIWKASIKLTVVQYRTDFQVFSNHAMLIKALVWYPERHGVIEWFMLGEALKIIQFQPPC